MVSGVCSFAKCWLIFRISLWDSLTQIPLHLNMLPHCQARWLSCLSTSTVRTLNGSQLLTSITHWTVFVLDPPTDTWGNWCYSVYCCCVTPVLHMANTVLHSQLLGSNLWVNYISSATCVCECIGWEVHKRLSYIECNWPYFVGFGLPLAITTSLPTSFIVR